MFSYFGMQLGSTGSIFSFVLGFSVLAFFIGEVAWFFFGRRRYFKPLQANPADDKRFYFLWTLIPALVLAALTIVHTLPERPQVTGKEEKKRIRFIRRRPPTPPSHQGE